MSFKNFFLFLFVFFIFMGFQEILHASFRVPGLISDPNWLVDEEIAQICPGFNEGFIKCRPPRGGYNELTENQRILNSWGYKAKSFEEIKDLLPAPHYNMYINPDVWGTFRINETSWEVVKPRGPLWDKFLAQTKKNIKTCYLDEDGWLRNYNYGTPFPEIDENDPHIALKLCWNYFKRYQDNDRLVGIDLTTKDRKGGERHNLVMNRRLLFNARVRDCPMTDNGLYKPNTHNLDFIYASPYVAPYNLRGTICLYYRYDDPKRDDDMWIYIPSIRRVRRMSTAQHQDRLPGGLDWTWDNTEGFEGNVIRFNWTYLGRKELLIPIIGHAHSYHNPKGHLNSNDQFYQRRNCYIIKASYKEPINMTDLILYLDPILYAACYSIDLDMKGREWIVQLITQGRDNSWFYSMYNDYAIDILRQHSTRAEFSYSGAEDFVLNDLTMDNLKKIYLSR